MGEFWRAFRFFIKTPVFYLQWAVIAVGIVCSHINSGIYGSPLLGAISIISTFASIGIFYWLLCKGRTNASLSPSRNWIKILWSVYAFRLPLLILFSPAFYVFLKYGTFESLTRAYFAMTIASESSKWEQLGDLLEIAWPWIVLLLLFFALDQAGRSHVVAQATSKRSFRSCFWALYALKIPILFFMIGESSLFALDTMDIFFDPMGIINPWVQPMIRVGIAPLRVLLELCATIAMATHLKSMLSIPSQQ